MSESMDRRGFVALGVGALAVAAAPPLLRPRQRLVRRSVPLMGTVAEVALPMRSEAIGQAAIGAGFDELRRIETLMSRFRTDSDVGRFNRARVGQLVSVAPETGEVVRTALNWAARTDGHFDPCLARLSELWDPAEHSEPPAPELVAALAGRSLWRAVSLEGDPGAPGLRKLDADAALDLGGIAKGYGVDRAVSVLRALGVERGIVNVGGDLMAFGPGPRGRPWRVGVRDPNDPATMKRVLDVLDEAVATSGDYLRYFEFGGHRYHHLLDPASGAPTTSGVHTVTIAGRDVMNADAAATSAFAAGRMVEAASQRWQPGLRVVDLG